MFQHFWCCYTGQSIILVHRLRMLYLHMFLFLMLVLLGVQENLNAILEMIFFSCNSSEIYLIIEWYFLVKDDSKISNCSSHSSCSLPRMILSSEGLFQNLEWINNMSVFSSLSFSYFVPSISKCQITVSNLVSNGVNVIIFEGLIELGVDCVKMVV